MKKIEGVDITPEHKREFKEAKAQAELGIARLNTVCAITGRPYRWLLDKIKAPAPELPDDWGPEPDPDHDVDAYRPRAMAEDNDEQGGDD